ncbi:MAG: tricorn protease interacting factor [Actinomycetota bacterium]
MSESSSAYRLPYAVEPQHYELTLSPDLDAAAFTGEERVRVVVHEPVTEIVLNAAELEIHTAELTSDEGDRREATITIDEENQRATITLDGEAATGPWTLGLTFSGILNDKLRGFYRSTFTDDGDAEHVIATTQFESTDARRAFPCWDEPDRKATFGVTLIVDDELTAISNSPIVEETDLGNGKRQVEFADTMRMSTYLVAFIVGPFEFSKTVDVDGVPLRVAAVPGKSQLWDFALECGAHSLRYFTTYFGLPYPGDKLDLIAVPDFAFGAMENLGAVTFRETALLVDRDVASRLELERVADVVAHEIAHMWFGDLVTMKWWNGIWLNEAFATFMELLCVDDFQPEWQRWVSFGTSRAQAMGVDGLSSTRPVEFPVGRPEEAEAMFDVLTYQKGSAVLRMLEQYIGADEFRQGIAAYIKKHSYGNTETTDLWDAIEETTGQPARSTMDTWIFQGGYPLLTVAEEDGGTRLVISQSPFRYRGGGEDSTRWHVPVLVRAGVSGDVEHHRTLLSDAAGEIDFSSAPDWVVVNDGGSGFYRVQYPPDMARRLVAEPDRLAPLERFNLVSDAWAAVLAGHSPLADFVDLIGHFSAERDPDVWSAILGPLQLVDRFAAPAVKDGLSRFVRDLVRPGFDELGWQPADDEPGRVGSLRGTFVATLGTIGADPEVRAKAAEVHAAYLRDRSAVPGDLAAPILAVAARNGGEEEYSTFLNRMRNPETPQEEIRYLLALAEVPHPALLRRTLEMALTEVRTQNAPFVIATSLTNRAAGADAWQFVEAHWDDLRRRFPSKLIPRMLEGITALIDPVLATTIHRFLDAHPVPGGDLLINQSRERLDVNVAFREREEPNLPKLFAAD